MDNIIRKTIDPHGEAGSAGPVSDLLFALYRLKRATLRRFVRWAAVRFEGGNYRSWTLRHVFSVYHGIDVGMHTGRGCFVEYNFRHGTTIGRYTTIYATAQAFNANHPMNTKSTHSYFFNPADGFSQKNLITYTKLNIGSDVFIGHNAIILPTVSSIGDGAIIGAGAVVHIDIPPFAIVVGNPCRIVRYRFSDEKIEELLATRWWERPLKDLLPDLGSFQQPLEGKESIR